LPAATAHRGDTDPRISSGGTEFHPRRLQFESARRGLLRQLKVRRLNRDFTAAGRGCAVRGDTERDRRPALAACFVKNDPGRIRTQRPGAFGGSRDGDVA
jgi:hypothetical protein